MQAGCSEGEWGGGPFILAAVGITSNFPEWRELYQQWCPGTGDRRHIGPGHVCSWIHAHQDKSCAVTAQVLAASWLLSGSEPASAFFPFPWWLQKYVSSLNLSKLVAACN